MFWKYLLAERFAAYQGALCCTESSADWVVQCDCLEEDWNEAGVMSQQFWKKLRGTSRNLSVKNRSRFLE